MFYVQITKLFCINTVPLVKHIESNLIFVFILHWLASDTAFVSFWLLLQYYIATTGLFTWLFYTLVAITCPVLNAPDNGMISCSLKGDGVQDTCYFTCNDGYELDESDNLTCTQSGSWSAGTPTCVRSEWLNHKCR